MHFPTDLPSILHRVHTFDGKQYAASRNYLDGGVSGLSPYLSRGVVSLPFVKEAILQHHTLQEAYRFIYELAWREYFQRTWWRLGDRIFSDIKNAQQPVIHRSLIKSVTTATTGIQAIDEQIKMLCSTGYMHNHARMYIASLVCNIGQAHWHPSAQWLYYHLLDGDIASNTLNWQWVAGTFSSKKYFFNQHNVNVFSRQEQHHTFLDFPYEALPYLNVPEQLKDTSTPHLATTLPSQHTPLLDYSKPLFLYTTYNLDPRWREEEDANRLLLLEPSHFYKFPVSGRVMNFILKLTENINGIQVFVGEVSEIPGLKSFSVIRSKAHPAFTHYPGLRDEMEWMFPKIIPKEGSFSSFWKKCEQFMINVVT
ncbi:MAG: deoxyribodipyrimidine photolyase [Cyclobacteriaceae bacterium]|nr:deoxyribodipyrimidine photolyase [Cyclobacteriaceae bacterium]